MLHWLKENSDKRVGKLQSLINETSTNELRLDFSSKSLILLGEWLYDILETRLISEEEIAEIEERMPEWVKAGMERRTKRLTEKSISISFDTAIYFGLTLLRNHPELKCSVHKGGKLDIDHNQPVIVGFKYSPFNPYQIIATGAVLSIQEGDKNRLFELYNIWIEML